MISLCKQVSSVLTCDEELGWMCFYCDIVDSAPALSDLYQKKKSIFQYPSILKISPRDAFRSRIFVSAFSLQVNVDGAYVNWAEVDMQHRKMVVSLCAHSLSSSNPSYAYFTVTEISGQDNFKPECRTRGKLCANAFGTLERYNISVSHNFELLI